MTGKSGQRPRKVLFVTTMAGAPWGGSEELWCGTALRLRALGHPVGAAVFEWPSRPRRVEELVAKGVEVAFRPRAKGTAGRLWERCLRRLARTRVHHEHIAFLKRSAPDLVVISQGWPWEGLAWMNACRALNLRYAPIVHANGEHWWPQDEWLEDIRGGYSGAARIFFVSPQNRDLAEMQCGMRFGNASVVTNPTNVDATAPPPWPDDDSTTRIACVGRLEPQAKGQDVLLRVLARPEWRERPIHLNFFGGGPCRRSLESLARMLRLPNVGFCGQVPDVRGIWADHHALVLASRYEGLPLVIVEAMLCGRPVITTNVAGNTEYLQDGITGFVAEAPTEGLLAEALERAWASRPEWAAMGARARAEVTARVPADPIGRFAEILQSLAE